MAKPTEEELRQALGNLHDQIDEDCPSEYRTRHLRESMKKARKLCRAFDVAEKLSSRKGDEEE